MTDPGQGRSTLARISSADEGDIRTDCQGLDLMDSPRQLDGQDHPPTDPQARGQTDVEPTSARTLCKYIYIYVLESSARFARAEAYGII